MMALTQLAAAANPARRRKGRCVCECECECGSPWPPQPQGTFLVVRYDAADVGARPIPSGDVFWASPDIWVVGGDAMGNPIGGKRCELHALVHNFGGIAAFPVQVEFAFIAPSLGIPANAPKVIATVNVPQPIPAGGGVGEAHCEWTPPKTAGDTHACALVTASCPLLGDAATVPWNPVADRHTGQRNLTIMEAAVGQAYEFDFQLANLRPAAARVEVAVSAAWHAGEQVARETVMGQPFLAGTLLALNQPQGASALRSWAKRAQTLAEVQRREPMREVPHAQVREMVRVLRIERGERLRSGAIAPSPVRAIPDAIPMVPVGEHLELESLASAHVRVSVTVPREAAGQWLIVNVGQLTNGVLDGGYSVAFRTGSGRPRQGRARAR